MLSAMPAGLVSRFWVVRDRVAREAPAEVVVRGSCFLKLGLRLGLLNLRCGERDAWRRAAVEHSLHCVCARASARALSPLVRKGKRLRGGIYG